MDIFQVITLPHRHQSAAEVEVSGDISGGQVLLVVPVYIEDGLSALGFLDAVTVSIVDEGGRVAVIGYGYGAVLSIPGYGLAAAGK